MRQGHIDDLYSLLRFPSVSTDTAFCGNVRDCASWLLQKVRSIGLEGRLVETSRHPIIWAKNRHTAGRRTVLIYGHYDVQPPDPVDLWDSPPFEPTTRDGFVFARGSSDNKGPILSHILGLQETLQEAGDLPVNLHLLIEGEEEIGSPSLAPFLTANRDELRCDVAVVSDTEMGGPGIPALTYALRGLVALEIKVTAAKVDLHSGTFGGAVANPITALAQLLATIHDRDGRILIEGFYDEVKLPATWEREGMQQQTAKIERQILAEAGAPVLFGEQGHSTLERLWFRPTAEINGIRGGYQGEGTKTVIPAFASAKLTFRLVPNQNVEQVIQQVTNHLRGHVPAGARLEILDCNGGSWFLTDPYSPFGKAAQRALQSVFPSEVRLVRGGGGIPIASDLRDILGVETLLVGLALPGCQWHSPNESFPIANLEAGIRLNKAILTEIASLPV